VRVIESDRAPPVQLHGNLFVKTSEVASDTLADRILEVPEDFEKSGDLDDPRSGYVAYVPVGSIARGRTLVEQGSLPCGTCHGADLRGSGDAPPIAGRSPSYIVRQLHDFKTGARNGSLAAQMQLVVATLGQNEMLAISAYLASLPRT
jgi:cytochrome c553